MFTIKKKKKKKKTSEERGWANIAAGSGLRDDRGKGTEYCMRGRSCAALGPRDREDRAIDPASRG